MPKAEEEKPRRIEVKAGKKTVEARPQAYGRSQAGARRRAGRPQAPPGPTPTLDRRQAFTTESDD